MPKLPQSMFKSRENVANLPSFVHAKSSLLFGLCALLTRRGVNMIPLRAVLSLLLISWTPVRLTVTDLFVKHRRFLDILYWITFLSGYANQAILLTIIWVILNYAFLHQFPGHLEGKLFPIFIPEHYGERCSQHLFDPYRDGHMFSSNKSYQIPLIQI